VHQRLERFLLARYFGESTRYPFAARAGSEHGYHLTIPGTILCAHRSKIAIAKLRQRLGRLAEDLRRWGWRMLYQAIRREG
jgi:hypothetical protein